MIDVTIHGEMLGAATYNYSDEEFEKTCFDAWVKQLVRRSDFSYFEVQFTSGIKYSFQKSNVVTGNNYLRRHIWN